MQEMIEMPFRGVHWNTDPEKRKEAIRKNSEAHLAEKNPRWKGSEADPTAGNQRARRLVSTPQGKEIHHIDGNPQNNDLSNLEFLTRKEHMRRDGRLQKLIERNKKGRKK